MRKSHCLLHKLLNVLELIRFIFSCTNFDDTFILFSSHIFSWQRHSSPRRFMYSRKQWLVAQSACHTLRFISGKSHLVIFMIASIYFVITFRNELWKDFLNLSAGASCCLQRIPVLTSLFQPWFLYWPLCVWMNWTKPTNS